MKKIYTCLFCFMSFFLISQPAVTWAQSAGDSINESIRKLATDAAGNTYVVGYYTSSSFAIGSNTFTSPGNLQQMFIAKYDASGNVIWAKNAMGTMSDARCIVIDKSSNIYIAGIYFTSFTFGSFTLNSAGSMDIFLAKMDNNGSVTWVKSIGGASGDFASAITSDGVNNIYLTGQFQSNILTVDTSTVSNSGNLDIFTAKLDSSGNTLWLRSAGAQMNEESASVAVDNSGNVYVGGDFESAALTLGTFSLTNTSNGLQDLLLFKYDANGNVLWAKSAGSIAADYISAIVLANAGVYTTGEFRGPMVLGNNTLTCSGISDLFVAKFDTLGNIVWAKREGNNGVENGTAICADAVGNIYVAGVFNSSMITFGSFNFNNAGNFDISLVRYNANGVVQWAMTFGGIDIDEMNEVNITNNVLFAAGDYRSNPFHVGSWNLGNVGNQDAFLTKVALPMGIETYEQQVSFLAYPIPFSDYLIIDLPEGVNSEIKVVNTMGVPVYYTSAAGTMKVFLDAYPPGVYFIRVTTPTSTLTKQIVKKY